MKAKIILSGIILFKIVIISQPWLKSSNVLSIKKNKNK